MPWSRGNGTLDVDGVFDGSSEDWDEEVDEAVGRRRMSVISSSADSERSKT